MAGVLFVVCVPTTKYEAELTKSLQRADENNSNLNINKKTDFHKSESYLFKNNNINKQKQQQVEQEQISNNNKSNKLFRAVTTGALDNVTADDKLLISPSSNKNTLTVQQFLHSSQKQPQQTSTHSLNVPVPTVSIPDQTSTSTSAIANNVASGGDDDSTEFFLQYDKIPMEKVLVKVLTKLKIDNAVWCPGKNNNFYQVTFSTGSGDACEECLQCLQDCGIGQRLNSVVSVIPCSLYYEGQESDMVNCRAGGLEGSSEEDIAGSDEKLKDGKTSAWSKFVNSVRARLTVAQVVEQVRANAELTFDFVMLLFVAGLVAALGLVENSSVVLVASMLISPLMGPILAGTFGTVIQDRQLQRIGVLHELFGLLMCLVIGFFFGLIIASAVDHWGTGDWPTSEMISRGLTRSLWVGCLIALPSGAGVALSVLGGNAGSLVGVAISASLLPPAVNAGLFWALAVIELIRSTSDPYQETIHHIMDSHNETAAAIDAAIAAKTLPPYYSEYKPVEYACLGAVSLTLTLLNIACIFVAGIIVLKIKEVAPKTSRDDMDIFWKHDIKIARDYNRTMHGDEGKNLGKQLMEEFAGMSSEKLNTIVDEATRNSILAKIRRLSLMNNGPSNYNDLTVTSTGFQRSNQSTWSPNTGTYNRPTVHELEDLYATITGHRARQFPAPASRRYSISSGAAARRVSVGRNAAQPQAPNQLATILESTNSPMNTPPVQLRHNARRSSCQQQQQGSDETPSSMRFVVTPATEQDTTKNKSTTIEMRQSPSKKFSF